MYIALNNKTIKVKFTNMENEVTVKELNDMEKEKLDITTSNYVYKIIRLIDS
ncbi:hypothetical protein HP397_03820 [Streptobacillus felis]|uniref:Uncharacterized protein n=1 Tax=Streptobacillus felis TaxID=1384509 RepID=A0A7Z0PFV5_9FUSO|nr:hypothetical protein [Streptobacillus felis]NYV27948.1 hypothetical protein [Streptobacillus felis]